MMRLASSLLVAGTMFAEAAGGLAATTNVGLIEIRDTIGPATANYITRAIDSAANDHDACLIIELDTPGGLIASTKDIIQKFYASPVPIVVYVAPSGAMAASAGTFITMAADVAAMAPNTTIGAAHPVELSPSGSVQAPDEVVNKKEESAISSFIEAIAERHGRNVQWARSAVLESASVTASNALQLNVIDIIAKDVPDLLKQMDGRVIDGRPLKTADATVVPIPMAPYEKLFQMLWQPPVMLLLMLVAMYGIIGEINHPGAILPGVAGGIALILFLYMSTVLPVNAAGVVLVILALILFAVDVYAPTHGVLTVGGIISFFLGALMLFNRAGPEYQLPLTYVIVATATTAAFFLFVIGKGVRAQRLPARTGRETMLGRTAPALTAIDANGGKVFLEGEYWNAVSAVPVAKDQDVKIVGIAGLTLKVQPVQG